MQNKSRKLLYKSLEVDLDKHETKQLSHGLKESVELGMEKQELEELRSGLRKAGEQASFAPGFSSRVMHRIYEMENIPGNLRSFLDYFHAAFFRVAAVAAFACFVLVFLNILTPSQNQGTDLVENEDASLNEMYEQLSYSLLEEVL